MRSIRIFAVVALTTCAGAARSASAVITAFWIPIASGDGSVGTPYPAAAVTADAALLGMQTWDLRVMYDEGDWGSAGLRATLPAGFRFYRSTNSGITKPQLTTANREFWTYVTAPRDSEDAQVLGGFPDGPASNGTGNGTNTPGVLSAFWGDLVHVPPGNYHIARLTFPLGVLPDVLTSDQSATFSYTRQVAPDSTAAIPEIPEPASGLLALLGLSFGATWRGRSMQRLLRRVHQ